MLGALQFFYLAKSDQYGTTNATVIRYVPSQGRSNLYDQNRSNYVALIGSSDIGHLVFLLVNWDYLNFCRSYQNELEEETMEQLCHCIALSKIRAELLRSPFLQDLTDTSIKRFCIICISATGWFLKD